MLDPHATPPLARERGTEQPLTPERREELVTMLRTAWRNPPEADGPSPSEKLAAEEKLAALEAEVEKPMLALSPTTKASRLLASAETA